MDPQKHRELASQGGKAAWAKGRAHRWSAEEARLAGQKGGRASVKVRFGGEKVSPHTTKEG